jgi:hypothetical protein
MRYSLGPRFTIEVHCEKCFEDLNNRIAEVWGTPNIDLYCYPDCDGYSDFNSHCDRHPRGLQ